MHVHRIPQFILDSSHPWIVQHERLLNSLPDTEDALCSLTSPYRPSTDSSSNSSSLTYPKDLFHSLEINNNKITSTDRGWINVNNEIGIIRRPWMTAVERLQEISRCPAALKDAQTFHVEIWGSHNAFNGRGEVLGFPSLPAEEVTLPPSLPVFSHKF
ncbi:hypothetical protein AA313_de0203017 [Arthrobotrys entomopaga]|nr:hypothetical protein AA313_de0203017 [Arthrobotrys entomopaga]